MLMLFGIGSQLNAQSVEGKWYGIGRVQMDDESDNYMTEMILKQDGKQVKGEFNYYFKDIQKSNKIEGEFDKKTRILIIKGLPIVFYKSNDSRKSVETVMTGRFELRVSKTASVLNGILLSKPEYQYVVPEIKYRFLRSMGNPIDTAVTEDEPDFSEMDKEIEDNFKNSSKVDSLALAKQRNKTKIDNDKIDKAKIDSDKIDKVKNEATKEKGLAKTKAPKSVGSKEAIVNNSLVTASTKSNKNQTEQILPIKDTATTVDSRKKNPIKEIESANEHIQVENKAINSSKIDSQALAKARINAKTDSTKIDQAKNEATKGKGMAKTKVPKPDVVKESVVNNNDLLSNNKNGKPVSNTIPTTALVTTLTTSTKNQIEQPLPIKDTVPIVETRLKNYIREIDIDNENIRVEIYDNGTIDYDSVSLYLNGKEVMAKSMLNHRSIKLNLHLDPNKEFNELSMFAENLGMTPPNTAALIVRDGQKEYQLLLQSDFSKSATLKLKVKKHTP